MSQGRRTRSEPAVSEPEEAAPPLLEEREPENRAHRIVAMVSGDELEALQNVARERRVAVATVAYELLQPALAGLVTRR